MTGQPAWKRTPEQLGLTPKEFVAALAKQREQGLLESDSPEQQERLRRWLEKNRAPANKPVLP
jgi:hypothetical protein